MRKPQDGEAWNTRAGYKMIIVYDGFKATPPTAEFPAGSRKALDFLKKAKELFGHESWSWSPPENFDDFGHREGGGWGGGGGDLVEYLGSISENEDDWSDE